jgi:hypothetical protein
MAASSALRPGEVAGPSAVAARRSFNDSPITWLRIVAVVAVAFTFGNALWAAWDQGITYDEYYHLEWPRRLLLDRVDDRESAMRFYSKTPVLLPAVVTVSGLERLGHEAERTLRFAARLTPIFYLAVCLALTAALARSLNPNAAWLAVLLVALDPNLAAHASIATSDVAYAMAVLVLAWALVRATESRASELRIGAALGLAFAIKYTAVLLVPVAVGEIVLRARRSPAALAGRLIVLVGASCLSASALYLLVGVGVPLGSISFHTPLLQDFATAWPSLRLPFPASILTGVDLSKEHNDHLAWNCYIFGEIRPRGVWYYFIAHWLMKTPLSLVAAVLVGLWQFRPNWRRRPFGILAVLFVIHLAYFSFFFSTQLGIRFALLCIPLASIVAACGLARTTPLRPAWLLLLAAPALAERVPYWGDPIAFTNLSVWPKSRAYWYTGDSNLDYGQNRERLERYVKESRLSAVVDQATVTPGLYVVGANDLLNIRANRWLINRDIPVTRFGFTNFGFSITSERFEAYMNETRVAPSLRDFDDLCSGALPHYPPGSKVPFVQGNSPDGGRMWVVCATSKKGVDLGLTVLTGRVLFGRVVGNNACPSELVQAKQASWFRVPRQGRAQLCLTEIPFRRTSLPYLVDSYLTVRGQGAEVEFRPIPVNRLSTRYGQETVP